MTPVLWNQRRENHAEEEVSGNHSRILTCARLGRARRLKGRQGVCCFAAGPGTIRSRRFFRCGLVTLVTAALTGIPVLIGISVAIDLSQVLRLFVEMLTRGPVALPGSNVPSVSLACCVEQSEHNG